MTLKKPERPGRSWLLVRLALAEMSAIAIFEDGEAAATRKSEQMKIMKARAEWVGGEGGRNDEACENAFDSVP
jgi:hypothetical protein